MNISVRIEQRLVFDRFLFSLLSVREKNQSVRIRNVLWFIQTTFSALNAS
jgi:hypothetical protein